MRNEADGCEDFVGVVLCEVLGQRPVDLFFELGRITPTSRFVHVGMGLRRTPQQMSRRLTSGRVTALDVYNPQEAPGGALARRAASPANSSVRRARTTVAVGLSSSGASGHVTIWSLARTYGNDNWLRFGS